MTDAATGRSCGTVLLPGSMEVEPMTQHAGLVRIERPSGTDLKAARGAMLAKGHTCGCYAQVSRNPFYTGILGHFRAFHPDSLAVLEDAQAVALLLLALEASGGREIPWPTRVLPAPVKIG